MAMMRYLFLFVFCSLVAAPLNAQIIQSPARWHYTSKKLSGNEYELIFHLDLKKGWHIFADEDTHGLKKRKNHSFITPSFIYDKNDNVILRGATSSKGLLETKKIKHFGLVNIYSYKVLYVQKIQAKAGTKVSGNYTYQICNDEKTLKPITEQFNVVIQ